MAKKREVEMPEDWNDRAGWDAYYEFQRTRTRRDPWEDRTGSFGVDQLPEFAEELKGRGWQSVWLPGCGCSPLARLLSHLGLDAVATDVSPVAVEFQRSKAGEFAHLTAELGAASSDGSFSVEVHDFRSEFREKAFDLIINVKAFQAFSIEDMRRIAGVHATALRKGRHAYFDTMNVQGERRDTLERSLEDGGFVVPLRALNQWYRRALSDTGLPYVFILGSPMIPRNDEYADGGPKWERDMARLREVSMEYADRLQIEQELEQQRIGPETKMAQVIYSTG